MLPQETMIALMIGKWETLLICSVLLILFIAKQLSQRRPGDPPASSDMEKFNWRLWIAQGFGVGRAHFGPGALGSLVGVLWFALLLTSGSICLFAAGAVGGVALSVWLCGVAEKVLRETDPPSVVLDEIAALPLCFAAWVGILVRKTGSLPSWDDFCSGRNWPLTLGVFVAFRLFDVTKPWPVR
ncbi:MAG: hypothetical protein DME25_08745, partial [Verrucomicrobia bacterium]